MQLAVMDVQLLRVPCVSHLSPWLPVFRQRILPMILCLVVLMSLPVNSGSKGDIAAKCKTCTDIVKNIVEGIRKTEKSNFGGGNTKWEEQSLGSYSNSETRLLEILEGACDGDKECHQMLEEHEETLEKWWFKMYPKDKNRDLLAYLCVNSIKVCCPNGTYGPDCDECTGGKERPCKGNGKCRGEGTRSGVGDCKCNSGYSGALCDACVNKYYEESKNDTNTICNACHESCDKKCTGAGPEGCVDCKEGWSLIGQGCQDVDECEDDACQDDEYCSNTPGSYKCLACDVACSGCNGPTSTGCDDCADRYYRDEDKTCRVCHISCANSCTHGGANGCDDCKDGWLLGDDDHCQDIDECAADVSPCEGDSNCVNTQGSYRCSTCHYACNGCTGDGADKCKECKPGYSRNVDDMCLDDDECERDDACPGEFTWCINTPGSYKCDCTAGYTLLDGICVERSKDAQPKALPKSSSEKASIKKNSPKKKAPKKVDEEKPKKTTKKQKKKNKKSNKKNNKSTNILDNDYGQYWFSLVGFALIGFLLRSSVFAQIVFTATFWVYLFWFSMRFDKLRSSG